MAVHNVTNKKLVEYLRQLPLLTDEITVFLYLLQAGPQTVLEISRGLQTGRTKLYPLLERLADKQLISVQERHYGTVYHPADPAALGFLVDQQEKLSQSLRSDLPGTLHLLKELQQLSPTTSKLVEYHDIEGIKQMYWNLNQVETDYYILELPAVTKQIGRHLHEKLRPLLLKKAGTGHVFTNQKKPTEPAHFISPNTFIIDFETYVYNNVVSLISIDGKELYGVEIHNQQLAKQYKQLLSLLEH